MAFDVKDRTEFATRDGISQCAHRWPEAPIMSNSKYYAGFAAGLEHPRCISTAQRKRFLAEHLLSRGRTGNHLWRMQRMRRRQQDGVDAAICEDGVEIGCQLKMMFGAKVLRAFEVGLHGTQDLQTFVAERGLDETAAPAAEADDRCADHLITSDATGRRGIASIDRNFVSIRRPGNAVPLRSSPMIPTGAYGCMIMLVISISRLLCLDAGGFGIRRPSRDLAADKGAEFVRTHRRNDHADACELLADCGHRQEFFAFGIEFVDDRLRRARRR